MLRERRRVRRRADPLHRLLRSAAGHGLLLPGVRGERDRPPVRATGRLHTEHLAMPDASLRRQAPGAPRVIGPAVRRGLAVGLAAALIAEVSARAEDAAAVPRAERHSPRQGYPSIGPAGARN